jgi:tripartite-type tricarboxylate transporter receptor subunit TctC
MVVATLPGGAPDILGRVLAAQLSERLGQQVKATPKLKRLLAKLCAR